MLLFIYFLQFLSKNKFMKSFGYNFYLIVINNSILVSVNKLKTQLIQVI